MVGRDAAPSGQRRRGGSGISQHELTGIFAEPLCHGFRQDTAEGYVCALQRSDEACGSRQPGSGLQGSLSRSVKMSWSWPPSPLGFMDAIGETTTGISEWNSRNY